MKRKLFTLAALMSATLGLNAQQTLEVYSAYDVNQDTKVQVEDVTSVVNATLANSTAEDKTVVDAAKLNALLLDIYQKLEKLEKLEAEHAEIMAKLDYYALTPDENGIRANGHEYVDLGMKDEQGRTIYWANFNVGADKPEDAGLYFAWGETVGYTSDTNDGREFYWANYKWMKSGCSDDEHITKYTFADNHISADWYSNGKFIGDGKTVLDPEDDAAHVNWGGDWRMPTYEELNQLKTKCTWTWNSTKQGYTVKGPNGNSIFLPAAGFRFESYFNDSGVYGDYWSSSLYASDSHFAYSLLLSSGYLDWSGSIRSYGHSVRAVCVSQN